jgi:hypothetical protein
MSSEDGRIVVGKEYGRARHKPSFETWGLRNRTRPTALMPPWLLRRADPQTNRRKRCYSTSVGSATVRTDGRRWLAVSFRSAIACTHGRARARTRGREQRTTWHVLCLRRFPPKLYRQMYANTGISIDSARVTRSLRWARWLAKPCRMLFAARPMPHLQTGVNGLQMLKQEKAGLTVFPS